MTFELDDGGIYRLVACPSSTTAKTCSFSEFTYGGTWFGPPDGDLVILDLSRLTNREATMLLDAISEAHGIGKLCGDLVMFNPELLEPVDYSYDIT